MKKFTVALVCMIMATGAAMAQRSFTFGPKVGFDMTNFWGSDTEHGMKPSYQVGAFAEFGVANNFAIAPEVVFAAQGGKFDHTTFNTNYINIPVMLKYYVSPAVSVDFGPQLGVNVYSKATTDISGTKVTTDLKDGTKDIDFGLGLGLTYNIAEDVFVQGRYTMGLTKAFDGDGDVKNGNIQVSIGYRF